MKLAVLFGTSSFESDVSVVSASSIIKNLDNKYSITPIYIDKNNDWYLVKDKIKSIYSLGELPTKLKKINNLPKLLKEFDLVLPIIHGNYGEDGAIQGFLRMLDVPFIGCDILSSSVCYDKFYTKYILRNGGINVTPDITIKMIDNKYLYLDDSYNYVETNIEDIDKLIIEKLSYPVFIKPCKCGSSIGVTKIDNKDTLNSSLKVAFKYDNKVLIEKEIIGRELECAVLKGKSMEVGEVLAHGDFYTFDSKYTDKESKTVIPADIVENIKKEIMATSEKAFSLVDGKDLARIDFFLETDTNKIILNEINTMPGWTEISMYPKLVEAVGITYQELIEILINKKGA